MAAPPRVQAGAARRSSVAAAAVGLAVLVLSALPVEASRVSEPELDVFRTVNDLPGALLFPPCPLMQFGAILVVPATTVAAVAFRRYRLALEVAAAGVAAWLLAKVVKDLVFRPRPAAILDDVNLHGATAAGRGFVSGHAAIVFALALLVTPYLPRRWRWAPWAVAAVVAFARVYVGAHFPLDVVVGAALGYELGLFTARLMASARLLPAPAPTLATAEAWLPVRVAPQADDAR